MGAAILRGLALSMLLVFPAPAHADDTLCAGVETTAEMRGCLEKAYERADAELNAVWKKVMASVSAADMPAKDRKAWKDELLAAQRAWITFKERDCGAVGFEWWRGTGAPGAMMSCLHAHTAARTNDLKVRYFDEEP